MVNTGIEMPNSPEMEQSVLGAIILSSSIPDEVSEVLQPEHFYSLKNRILYEEMVRLMNEDKPIDTVSLFEALNARQDGNEVPVSYLASLTQNITTTAHASYHSRVVFEKALARKGIARAYETIGKLQAGNGDVFDVLEQCSGALSDTVESAFDAVDDDRDLYSRKDEIFNDIVVRRDSDNSSAIMLKSLPTLNKIVGGIMPTDLIGIYGAEKSTKTTLAHEIAMDVGVDQKLPVGIFSFEVGQNELDWKSMSMRMDIPFSKLRNPKGMDGKVEFSDSDIEKLKDNFDETFKGSKIMISDAILNEQQIYSKVKKWKRKHGVRLIIIDYLMLIECMVSSGIRREDLNYLSRFFKRMAKKLEVPIILLSQANASGDRVAEAKGLERDANYFIYIQQAQDGDTVEMYDETHGTSEVLLQNTDYIATVRRMRHGKGGKSWLMTFTESGRYMEVDVISRVLNQLDNIPNADLSNLGN